MTSLVLSAEVLLIGKPPTWPSHSSPSSQTSPAPSSTVGVTSKGVWMISKPISVSSRLLNAMSVTKNSWGKISSPTTTKTASNSFDFPSRSGLYLLKGGFTLQEVLVDVWYVNNDDEDGVDYVGFNTLGMEASNQSLFKPSKMKIVVDTPEDPSFKMEVITVIGEGPYRAKRMADHDVILAVKGRVA